MIKLTRITHTTEDDNNTFEYYKDNKPIEETEFTSLRLRRCYYEMREVYYREDGLDVRTILLVKGDNDNDN